MEFLTEIESSMGVFTLYALMLGLVVMAFTYFVNTVRGIVITILGASMAYYFFVASPDTKKNMDSYMKSLYTTIVGGNISSLKKTVIDATSNVTDNIKTKMESAVSESLNK